VTNVPIVSSWVSEIVRFSSQFSKCNAGKCFIWSGAEDTGCHQSNTKATSTCTGPSCAVAYGEEIKWGDSSCSEYAWQANQLVGEADFYPSYGDTALGYDLSAENSGKEFIEIKFPNPVYVTGFELYETYKPGATYRISTTQKYDDDNTIACCGEDFPSGGNCDGRPACSTDTTWNTVWSGTASNTADTATIFSPNLCPYAYQTQFVRLDLDTAAASGWNNFDAAKVFGSLEMPPGLILPQSSAASGSENQVAYQALVGVHGVDSFDYQVTDCLGYGAAATITISLPEPLAAFQSTSHASFAAIQGAAGETTMTADLTTPIETGTFSLHQLLKGSANGVTVTCKGLTGVSNLTFGAYNCQTEGQTGVIAESGWSSAPAIFIGGDAAGQHAELWLQKNDSTLVFRVQVHGCPTMKMAFEDTAGYGSADTCTSCFDAPSTLGPRDTVTYDTICKDDVLAEKDRRDKESRDTFTIIIVVLGAVIGIVGIIGTYKGINYLNKMLHEAERQRLAKLERCTKAVKAAVTTQSCCFIITYEMLKNLGHLIPHEVARDSGALISLDNYEDLATFSMKNPIVFFSHQWLSWDDPDPDKLHYNEMLKACATLCKDFNYKPSELHLFLDYLSIPQNNMRLRLCAIDSLGVFSSICQHFIVVAPSVMHKDTKKMCDMASYAKRGWCRLEQARCVFVGLCCPSSES
jgi:hypothetical protein